MKQANHKLLEGKTTYGFTSNCQIASERQVAGLIPYHNWNAPFTGVAIGVC